MKAKQSEKLLGNQNARIGKHDSTVIRLSVASVDIICAALALAGNADPSRAEINEAVAYAVRQVYGRRIEDQIAPIIRDKCSTEQATAER